MEMRTDPENTRYVIFEGARKQSDEWDAPDQGVVQLKSAILEAGTDVGDAEEKRLEDPFAQLEKEEEDKTKASEQHKIISELYDLSERRWADPWTQSKKLRQQFREGKKVLKAKSLLADEIRNRNGLHIELLPESEEDAIRAKMIEFQGRSDREDALRKRELRLGVGKRARDAESKRRELERVVKLATREQTDPFLNRHNGTTEAPSLDRGIKVVKKRNIERGAVIGFTGYSSEE
jgi:coiled-coil domain-containing protein 130